MHEDVVAVLAGEEPEALLRAEPLHLAGRHKFSSQLLRPGAQVGATTTQASGPAFGPAPTYTSGTDACAR
jgi:hypothetical protein